MVALVQQRRKYCLENAGKVGGEAIGCSEALYEVKSVCTPLRHMGVKGKVHPITCHEGTEG
jgi:hypothetical protein